MAEQKQKKNKESDKPGERLYNIKDKDHNRQSHHINQDLIQKKLLKKQLIDGHYMEINAQNEVIARKGNEKIVRN